MAHRVTTLGYLVVALERKNARYLFSRKLCLIALSRFCRLSASKNSRTVRTFTDTPHRNTNTHSLCAHSLLLFITPDNRVLSHSSTQQLDIWANITDLHHLTHQLGPRSYPWLPPRTLLIFIVYSCFGPAIKSCCKQKLITNWVAILHSNISRD